jgi:hypothetical protein
LEAVAPAQPLAFSRPTPQLGRMLSRSADSHLPGAAYLEGLRIASTCP